jgi:hypothetical protein
MREYEMSEREKILDLIKSRMKGWSRHSVEYITLDLLMQKITQLPAAEEVEGWAIYHDGEFFEARLHQTTILEIAQKLGDPPCGWNPIEVCKVAIRPLEDK